VSLLLRSGVNPLPMQNPNVSPTSLVLFGDFFSGQVYTTQAVQSDKVFLMDTNDPLTGAGSFPRSEAEFLRIFSPNRFLRIVTKDQFEIYTPIITANYLEKSITLATPVPVTGAGGCGVTGFGDALDVNVAGFIRYSIQLDTRPNAPDWKTDLVREELQTDGATPVADSALVIADYAVDLQFYDFGFDTAVAGAEPNLVTFRLPNMVAGTGAGRLDNFTGAVPHQLRFLSVKLTVRSEDEDPRHQYQARAQEYSHLDGFDISDMDGACRTLSMGTRVFLTSIAVRNLR